MKIYSRNSKEVGNTTGSEKCCQLAGCNGRRLAVRWSDGKLTWPCTKGLLPFKKGLKIG